MNNFIEVMNSNGELIMLNLAYVMTIHPCDEEWASTHIVLTYGELYVRESYEKLKRMISGKTVIVEGAMNCYGR